MKVTSMEGGKESSVGPNRSDLDLGDIKDVARIHLEPGDFLAVNCDFHVTGAMAEQIKAGFKRFETQVGREIPILILEKGMRLTVVGPSPERVTDG